MMKNQIPSRMEKKKASRDANQQPLLVHTRSCFFFNEQEGLAPLLNIIKQERT
jgi:hypothetical protein